MNYTSHDPIAQVQPQQQHDKAAAAASLACLDAFYGTFTFQFERGLHTHILQIPFEKAWRIIEKVNTPARGFNVFVVSRQLHTIIAAANSNEQIEICGSDIVTGSPRARLPGTFVLKNPTAPRLVQLNGAADKSTPGASDTPTIARGYLERRWNPIPVSRRTKKPIGNGWQHRPLDSETIAKAFNRAGMNVGVQLGPMSNGLTDVDLDCREAVLVGPMLLPESNNIFGRASKRQSHWLYATTLANSITKACLQFKDVDDTMMLELKIGGGGKGSQSVFPGSIHTSGEAIEWEQDEPLVTVDDEMLLRQVHRLAVAVMLARHWPAKNARHDAALTVGGFLARAGLGEDETARMLKAIATGASDEEAADRVQAARDAVKQHGNGGETRGLPKLVETFGEKVARKVAEWLGYQDGYKPDNGLPELVTGREPTAVAKDLAKLIAQSDHYFFNGNTLVRVAVEADGMPRAIEVTAENVRVLAHEISNPTKQGRPAEIKTDVANIYLKGLEGRWGLNRFAGITTTPILSGNGIIRSADGYDRATGLWCHNIPALSIPSTPTGREAAAALERIRHTFRTFPFADAARVQDPELGIEVVDPSKPAGLDESSFVVALLTAACRRSLQTAPGFLCDAPTLSGAGTGKGLLVKAICIIASGAPPHAFTSGHDASEFDKRLVAVLVQGRPVVFLDNFNAKMLTSDTLASALTENPAQVRVMFDLWQQKHKGEPVRAARLDSEIIQLIDPNARKRDDGSLQYSRQRVARFLAQLGGTRVGGYTLIEGKEGPDSKPVANYTLVSNTLEPAPDPGELFDELRRKTAAEDTPEHVATEKYERSANGSVADEKRESRQSNGLMVGGRALAGSRCCLCGKGGTVHLVRRGNDGEVDQAHVTCAEDAWGDLPKEEKGNGGARK